MVHGGEEGMGSFSSAGEEMRKKGTEGALTREAKRKGKSMSELCESKEAKHGKLAKRCAFRKAARTVARRHRGGRR